MNEAVGLLETVGLTVTLTAVDAMPRELSGNEALK